MVHSGHMDFKGTPNPLVPPRRIIGNRKYKTKRKNTAYRSWQFDSASQRLTLTYRSFGDAESQRARRWLREFVDEIGATVPDLDVRAPPALVA